MSTVGLLPRQGKKGFSEGMALAEFQGLELT